MNKLNGTITQIQQSGNILLVDVLVSGQLFSALLIESSSKPLWLCENNAVSLIFKETEVSLAKGLSGMISLRNRMQCKVLRICRGKLLSTVELQFNDYPISSAITTRALDSLAIEPDDIVEALVKSNEVSLSSIQN